jgi:thiamine-phosphate pyrophosphorylase
MHGLYAIVDVVSLQRLGLDPQRYGEALVAAKPAAIQVRDKRQRAGETLALLRALAPTCRAAGVPLFANDRPDLAALAGCDGVHLGQHDLPAADAREVMAALHEPHARLPGGDRALVGLSVHDEEELTVALAADPDYIALGPVFDTGSKLAPEPTIGLEGLAALASRARQHGDRPLVAIGGLDVANAESVARHVACGAVIGALLVGADPPYGAVTARAEELHRRFQAGPWS